MQKFVKMPMCGLLASALLLGCGGSDSSDKNVEQVSDFQSYILQDSLEYSTAGLTKVIAPMQVGSTSFRLKIDSTETSPSFMFLEQYAASIGSHIAKIKITPEGETSALSFEFGSDSKDSGITFPNDTWVDLTLSWNVDNDELTLSATSDDADFGIANHTLGSLRAVQVVRVSHGEEDGISVTSEPVKIDAFEIFNSYGETVYSEPFDKTSDLSSFGSWGNNSVSSDSSKYVPSEVVSYSVNSFSANSMRTATLPSSDSHSVRLVNTSDNTGAHARYILADSMTKGTFSLDLNPDSKDSTEIFVFLGSEDGTYQNAVSYIKLRPEYYGTRIENVLYEPTEDKPNGTNLTQDTGFQIPHGEWRTLTLNFDVDNNQVSITMLDEKGNSGYSFTSELVNQVPVKYFDVRVGLTNETTQTGLGLLVDNFEVTDSEGNTVLKEGFDNNFLPDDSNNVSPGEPVAPVPSEQVILSNVISDSTGRWYFVDAQIDTADSSDVLDIDPLDPTELVDADPLNQQYVKITDLMTDDSGELRVSVYGGSHLGKIAYKLFYPTDETERYKLTLSSATTTNIYNVNSFTFDDGEIKDSNNTVLGTFEKGKWLDVLAEYNREDTTLYINGQTIGTIKNTSDNKLYYVRILSGSDSGTTDVGIYIDDLNIVTDLGRWIVDDFESYDAGAMLNTHNSAYLKETISAQILDDELSE